MKLLQLVCFVICLSTSCANDYTNYKVYDVTPTKKQIEDLMEWQFKSGIDFWLAGGVGQSSQVMVSPDVADSFLSFLNINKIQHELKIYDVEETLQRDKIDRVAERAKRSVLANINNPNFNLYWTFNEMEAYSVRLAQQYPGLVRRDVIGRSVEGRIIFGMRVSRSLSQFGKKPIVFLDSGVHAREWVGPHSVLYLLNQLVTNASVTNELVKNVDWVIVANSNPDGYVYSHEHDRLWRKNRRYVNKTCTGVDLNRNFAYVWQHAPNSCSGSGHPGSGPLSEPESYALAKYMESFKNNLRLYLAVHSYGNLVLWPFGFAHKTYIKNWKEHQRVGQKWIDAIKTTGTTYRMGNSADILYTANGASDDHAVAFANANLAYTLELTGGGKDGFDYPQDKVFNLARQTFLGYREFGMYVSEHFNYG